ncbi:MAG: hypothetical protein JNM58_11415 [Xanthomonadaceae bacterium]|nr:hypothetical protein [Xanthomonadaceae bacterium]
MSKHEISAWWRLGLSGVYGAYLLWVLFLAGQEAISTAMYYRTASMLSFIVLIWLSAWYLQRRKGIDQDERDRAITMTATRVALIAVVAIVAMTPIVLFETILGAKEAVTFRLDWAEFYINACLTFAIWVEASVTVFHHWRDRRQTA